MSSKELSKEEWFKIYEGIYALTNEVEKKASDKPWETWNLRIDSIDIVVERWGNFCYWDSIRVKRKGREVYRLELVLEPECRVDKKPKEDNDKRAESFFGKKKRVYFGNRFSFVEYLEGAVNQKQENLLDYWECVRDGCDPDAAKLYRREFRRIKGI